MQEYKVVLSSLARDDLQNIYDYVSHVASEWDAQIVLERIRNKINRFNFAPERTEPFGEDANGLPVRATTSGKYRVIYIVKRAEHEVLIARIVSVGYNHSKLFSPID